MHTFLETLCPENYTLTAVLAGFLLASDLSYDSQDILGGWLMLVGQLMQTNAGLGTLQQDRNEKKADAMRQQTETQSQSPH